MLVDDHRLFAKSIAIALDGYDEIDNFITDSDVQNSDKTVQNEKIDIVLMDINLGSLSGADGLETADKLLKSNPGLKIIVLTGFNLPVYRHEAKKIGISGFLNKDISPDELVTSLRRIFRGETCFPPEDSNIVLEELTITEKKILQLISAGKKRKTVAAELYMSERTLSNHLQHIFEKLNVKSTVEAVTKAMQLGYIPPLC